MPSLPLSLNTFYFDLYNYPTYLTCVNFVPNEYLYYEVNNIYLTDYPSCDSTICYNSIGDTIECVEEVIIDSLGCTNPVASNWNPSANIDDQSCLIQGCTDSLAINYNSMANVENTSCLYDYSHTQNLNLSIDNFNTSLDSVNQLNSLLNNINQSLNDSLDDALSLNFFYDTLNQSLNDSLDDALTSILILENILNTWITSRDLNEGWNIFGYSCPDPIDVTASLSFYVEKIIIVKDENGAVYMPEFNFNGIGYFLPNFGYQITVTENISGFDLCE